MNALPSLSRRGWLLVVVALLVTSFAASLWYLAPRTPGTELGLDQLRARIAAGEVERAVLLDEDARVTVVADGREFWAAYPGSDTMTATLVDELARSGAALSVDPQPAKSSVRLVATVLLPLVILAGLFGLVATGGGTGDVRRFGSLGGGPAPAPDARFSDVAGVDGSVEELREVVAYLRSPGQYADLGAAPPKGVLLHGPPGTGKTLIARATAGEAGVPFFSVAGAQFVESLVGVGAARVRDLFAQVREVAPAILFIDEIDAAGRRRGAGGEGGSDEREQTLNQLLVEMDGFAASSGVVVMAATNRPDILDPALLRPGRFDRHVVVEPPDVDGRARILALHLAGKPVADSVDVPALARRTPGFTGADLAGVVNEAALLAVRAGLPQVAQAQLTEAVSRVSTGSGHQGHALTGPARRRVAVHEAGAAVLSHLQGEEVHRVSVVARSRSLPRSVGTQAAPATRDELVSRLARALAGSVAEELVLGHASTLGEPGLEQASDLARDMVLRFGMGTDVGQRRLTGPTTDEHLGGGSVPDELSDALLALVEKDVRELLDLARQRAADLLEERADLVHRVSDRLLVEESLDEAELAGLLTAPART
ncbi:MAG TPA: AAA family ATPase [Nocardioides sp.]